MNIKKNIIRVFSIFVLMFLLVNLNSYAITIVIDPGHGGTDPGSSSKGLIERDLNMKIARYMEEYLREYSDINLLFTHNGTTMSLEDRADFAINNRADLMISVHINSANSSSKSGAEAYVTYRTDLPKYNQEMTILANRILGNISGTGIKNNGVATKRVANLNNDPEYKYFDGTNGDYYAIIRRSMKGGHAKDLGMDFSNGSGVPVVLVEHGYLSNDHDRALLDSDNELRALAKADSDAIVSFYGLNKNELIDVSGYIFNSTYYADMYSDLKAAFGYDENALRTHYYTFGIREGRSASPIFDPVYYLNNYTDLKNAFGNNAEAAYNHFVTFGAKEGRTASSLFDPSYYLDNYSDLKNAFGNNKTKAIMHFAVFGIKEGRKSSSNFNVIDYYNGCSGYVKNMLGRNYIKYYAHSKGGNVIYDAPINIRDYLFDAYTYYSLYPDLQSAIGYNPDALREHYYTFGIKEGRKPSKVFDPAYYLNSYTDLKNAFGNNAEAAYEHFVTKGINEGRKSSAEFDPVYYLNSYTDLKNAFGDNYSKGLAHFVTNGIRENRIASGS